MPRKPTIKKRTNKAKKLLLLKHGSLKKTEKYFTTNAQGHTTLSKRSVDYIPQFLQKIQSVLKDKQNFLNAISENDTLRTIARKQRIPASLIKTILSWKGTKDSIYAKINKGCGLKPERNELECQTKLILQKVLEGFENITGTSLILACQNFFSSRFFPFVCGTPDFCIKSENQRPLFVIECKEINSKAEFSKAFKRMKDGTLEIKRNSSCYHQLRAYLNIFLVPSGFLVVKHLDQIHLCKVFFEGFTEEEIDMLKQFYMFHILPSFILKTKPKVVSGRLEYFDDREKDLISRALEESGLKRWFEKSDRLQDYRFSKPNCDRCCKQCFGEDCGGAATAVRKALLRKCKTENWRGEKKQVRRFGRAAAKAKQVRWKLRSFRRWILRQ